MMTRDLYQHAQGRTFEIIATNDPNNKHVSDGPPDITLAATLSYLNQILLEEDIDVKDLLHLKDSDLYSMEKPLYDVLGQKYPPMKNQQLLNHTESSSGITDHRFSNQGSSNFGVLSASEYNKGLVEEIRFLPRIDKLVLGMEEKKLSFPPVPEEDDLVKLNLDKDGHKKIEDFMRCGSMGKKRSDVDLDILEGRTRKISMYHSEEPPRNEMLDKVLLDIGNYTEVASLQESIQCKTSTYCGNDTLGLFDVKALLVECSHAVYANDRQLAEHLINRIRKLSSLDGNGTQRMACAFADALESRLNGIGREAWRPPAGRIPASEFIKIAKLYITTCPFPSVSSYFANQTILKVAGKTSKLHIIDFGIGLGFQWPSLIQALANNSNCKSIKLKITGIDFPLPGFRPEKLIQETGRRLEAYAESLGVPFEYYGIASKWEDISVDDLRIKEDEVLIVNCMFRLKEVGDEAVSLDSPRNRVLKFIRQIQPLVFIHGIVNVGAYSPFFISRFKQVLGLYSSVHEIIDILIPGDNKQRQSLERCFLAHDILNAVACEGTDLIMKPETYKQWHLRNLRAGLEQIPLDPLLLKECKEKKEGANNKNIFFIEDDKNWLLLGWSARIIYGISTWKAKRA